MRWRSLLALLLILAVCAVNVAARTPRKPKQEEEVPVRWPGKQEPWDDEQHRRDIEALRRLTAQPGMSAEDEAALADARRESREERAAARGVDAHGSTLHGTSDEDGQEEEEEELQEEDVLASFAELQSIMGELASAMGSEDAAAALADGDGGEQYYQPMGHADAGDDDEEDEE